MITKILEVTNGPLNWGKFLIGRFDHEWERPSEFTGHAMLLPAIGWTPEHLLVLDLQTGEAAIFKPGGLASYDLEKHRIWVCPLFEPMLEWLYKQDLSDLSKLPDTLVLKDALFSMSGYRRPGPDEPLNPRLEAFVNWWMADHRIAPGAASHHDVMQLLQDFAKISEAAVLKTATELDIDIYDADGANGKILLHLLHENIEKEFKPRDPA